MPMIEIWYRGTIQECQPMKFQERVSYLIVVPVNLTNPVHWPYPTHLMLEFKLSPDRIHHLPSVALMPSQTAPTNPVTITVITALNV